MEKGDKEHKSVRCKMVNTGINPPTGGAQPTIQAAECMAICEALIELQSQPEYR